MKLRPEFSLQAALGKLNDQNANWAPIYQAGFSLHMTLEDMTLTTVTAVELPSFDTGQYDGCEFNMTRGNATLRICLAELPTFSMEFHRVRWHRFTQLHNCETSWIKEAYFRLVEVSPKEALSQYVKADRSTIKPYSELHHYRIFLDETGCHEIFAESVHVL